MYLRNFPIECQSGAAAPNFDQDSLMWLMEGTKKAFDLSERWLKISVVLEATHTMYNMQSTTLKSCTGGS